MKTLIFLTTMLVALSTTVSSLALPQLSKRQVLTISQPTSTLPAPSSISPAVSLKYVTLGVGTQNYTCAATPNSSSGIPVSTGAIATLYDAGVFLQGHPVMVSTLPGMALGFQVMTGGSIFPSLGIDQLGHHFFNAALQPTFDLTAVGARIVAKKADSVPAPADACPGPNGAGAVDWLQLEDAGDGQSFGDITFVYRVETAGGDAPTSCANEQGTFEVPYAAEYWFYGP
jgi:hypothetical protein